MAVSLSEYADAIRSKPLDEYEWWKHHVVFFAILLVFLPMLLTLYYGLAGLWELLGIDSVVYYLATGILYLFMVVAAVTAIGALPGYYYDAKYLRENDLPYDPHWKLYAIVHLTPVVGPFVAIPVYVLQRYRHAGLPMDRLY